MRREYIENYVLDQLSVLLFNEETIPDLVTKINQYQEHFDAEQLKDLKLYDKRLIETEKQINNIINAIASGFSESAFLGKMQELRQQKAEIEYRINEIRSSSPHIEIDEVVLKKVFSQYKEFIKTKNIPECKKFIESYVDKVVVYFDRVEVTFKVASPLLSVNGYTIKAELKKRKLFRYYKRLLADSLGKTTGAKKGGINHSNTSSENKLQREA